MNRKSNRSAVTRKHHTCFGLIINIFARIEFQMQITVAGILDTDLATAVILMSELGYRQKRQSLLHLNTTLGINGLVDPELVSILDDLHGYSDLRNSIAHNVWKRGNRKGSIKPMRLILRGPAPKPLGHWHNEQSYTVTDLMASAAELEGVSRRLSKLLKESGLEDRVHARIDAIKERTSAAGGNPSAR